MTLLHFLSGLAVGAVVGLTGAGGGILGMPVLVGSGMDMLSAKPIALLAVTVGAAISAIHGLRQGLVRYKAAAYMSLTGALASPLGSWLAVRLPTLWLTVAFSAVLLVVAWRSWHAMDASAAQHRQAMAPALCQTDAVSGKFIWTPACFAALGSVGALAGVMSGMLGVGGGFVVVPLLQRLTNLRYQSVVATSLAVIALVSAFAAGQLVWQGAQLGAGGWLFVVGTGCGALAGRLLAGRLPQKGLQRGFAVVVVLASLVLLLKAFYPQLLGS